MRYVFVSAAATRTAKGWEIIVRGIRSARPFVHAHMMRLLKRPNFALPAAAFVLAAVAALGFLTIGGDEAEAGTTTTVFVNDVTNDFCGTAASSCAQPYTIQISPGSTVEWLDGEAGIIPHTVTQCSGDGTGCPGGSPGFDSGALTDPSPNYLSQVFPTVGTFFYRCEVHLNLMRGIVEVASASVGGIADFPDIDGSPADASGASGGSSFTLALVSGLVAALAMFAAGAWYARRRWLS